MGDDDEDWPGRRVDRKRGSTVRCRRDIEPVNHLGGAVPEVVTTALPSVCSIDTTM